MRNIAKLALRLMIFSLAAGVPCRVIRQITEKDSLRFRPELLGGCAPMGE